MYADLPSRQRFLIQAALVSAWLLVAGGGIMQAALSPRGWLLDISGLGAALMSAIAAVGVALDRYQFEWVAAWMASAFLVPTLVMLWVESLADPRELLSSAMLVSALTAFFSVRALLCSAHSTRLRAQMRTREGDDAE